jgi:SM-20-related protein
LNQVFDALIETYLENNIGIAENFISLPLSTAIEKNIYSLANHNLLNKANVGNLKTLQQNKLIRSDSIFWLDRLHNNVDENLFLDIIDAFVAYLNQTCYTGITSYEFHYTLYKNGDFYAKHLDQFQNKSSRKYSMIIYLNKDWEAAHGGELCIHHPTFMQTIAPLNARVVFFKSNEIPHEVLLTTVNRLSITGWLKCDE